VVDSHVAPPLESKLPQQPGCGCRRLADLRTVAPGEWLAEARKQKSPPSLPKVAGEAKSYAEVAAAFGVGEGTVTHWRQQGAPITPRRPNNLAAIARWLAAREAARPGISIATSNAYLTAFKSFCRWLVRKGRLDKNPFEHVQALNARTDVRLERRTLPAEEFRQLLETTRQSTTVFRGLSGKDRAMLYLMGAYTGLRASELASLDPGSMDLDRGVPVAKTGPATRSRWWAYWSGSTLQGRSPEPAPATDRHRQGRENERRGTTFPGAAAGDGLICAIRRLHSTELKEWRARRSAAGTASISNRHHKASSQISTILQLA
jgi:integrase